MVLADLVHEFSLNINHRSPESSLTVACNSLTIACKTLTVACKSLTVACELVQILKSIAQQGNLLVSALDSRCDQGAPIANLTLAPEYRDRIAVPDVQLVDTVHRSEIGPDDSV